jgi:hypothetical protein
METTSMNKFSMTTIRSSSALIGPRLLLIDPRIHPHHFTSSYRAIQAGKQVTRTFAQKNLAFRVRFLSFNYSLTLPKSRASDRLAVECYSMVATRVLPSPFHSFHHLPLQFCRSLASDESINVAFGDIFRSYFWGPISKWESIQKSFREPFCFLYSPPVHATPGNRIISGY